MIFENKDREHHHWHHFKFISNAFYEFKGFGKTVTGYILMHSIGGIFFTYVVIAPILMNKMGISILQAELFFAAASILDVILTFIVGRYLDGISPNICMALDWLTESVPAFIFSLAITPFHFFIGLLSQKMTNFLNPAYRVYENEIFPQEKRNLIYSYHLLVPEIFQVIAFIVIGYTLTYVFPSILAIRVVLFICGIGLLLTALIPYKMLFKVKPLNIGKENSTIHFSKELYLVTLAEILKAICNELTSALIISYYILDEMSGTIMNVLMLEAVTSVVIVITGLFTRHLNETLSEYRISQLGILLLILYSIFMSRANSFAIVLAAISLQSVGNTIWFPSHSSIVMKLVPREKRGIFFSTINGVSKLIPIIVPVFAGLIAKMFGYYLIFILSMLFYISILFIYHVLSRRILNES